MAYSIANAAKPSRRSLFVSLQRVAAMEWFALALGTLALVLAVLIGAVLAVIVEGSEAVQEAKDERAYSVPDAAGEAASDQSSWRRLVRDRERAATEVHLSPDDRAGVQEAERIARR